MTVAPFVLSTAQMRERRGTKWHRHPNDVLPAWVADMDYAVADPVRQAVLRLAEQSDYGYPWREGSDSVEVAFAERMSERFGWSPDPARTQVVADLVQGITASLIAFSKAGDGVVVQTPIYPPFLAAIRNTDRKLQENPLVDGGTRLEVDMVGLEQSVNERTKVLLLCNPHNPSGRVLTREELLAIGRLAVERDLIIIADEIHCDLIYPGSCHFPIASLDPEIAVRTVTLNSATKAFNIAGLRCAVIHFGSDELHYQFHRMIPDRLLGGVSSVGIDATVAAWTEGQPWLEQVMEQLIANRAMLADWIISDTTGIKYYPPEATYLAWLDCSALDLPYDSPYTFFLEDARVGLNPGSDFGRPGQACVRLNFATAPEVLADALGRMAAAMDGRAAGRR